MFSLPFLSSSPKEAPPTTTTAPAPVPEPSQKPTAAPTPPPTAQTQPSAELWPSGPSKRSAKQLGLFFAGAGFLAFSTLVTRRAVVRKQIAAAPKFYQPSHRAPVSSSGGAAAGGNPEGSMIALEALNLATLNVISFAIMATGGLSWAFDVSSVDDLRRMARRHITGQGGKTDEAAEKEIEEWAARVLLGKGKTEDGGAAKGRGAVDQSGRKD